jgi:hypothetical protein
MPIPAQNITLAAGSGAQEARDLAAMMRPVIHQVKKNLPGRLRIGTSLSVLLGDRAQRVVIVQGTNSSLFGQLANNRETMHYNQYGDLIAQTSEDENREYGFYDEGHLAERPSRQHRSEARFLYKYDSAGTWTSKVTETRSDENQNFSVASTERRTLTYFDPI